MTNFLWILWILLVSTSFLNDNSRGNLQLNGQESRFTIAGEVEEFEPGNKIVVIKERWYFVEQEPDENGLFSINSNLFAAGMIYFVYDKFYTELYIEKGDSIFVSINPSESKFEFSGDNATINNYLFKRSSIDRKVNRKWLFQLPKDSFNVELGKINNSLDSLMRIFSPSMDSSFVNLEKKFLSLYKMKFSEQYSSRIKDNEQTAKIQYQMKPLLNDPDLIVYNHFRGYLYTDFKSRVHSQVLEEFSANNDPAGKMMALFDGIEKEYKHQRVQDYLYYINMYVFVKNNNDSLDFIQNRFNAFCQTSDYQEDINLLIKEKRSKIGKGKPAPEFTLSDINNQKISLKDFRGKTVYIDFWATWCAPCIKELPNWEKLRKEYSSSENITFLCISIDEDVKRWESYVKNKKLGGIQLIAPEGRQSSVNKAYTVSGIPRYVLIDKNGKIIDGNAPPPSSPEIKKILEQKR